MCGATDAQKGLAQQSTSLASDTNSDFLSRFAGQTDTINNLSNILQNVQNGKLLPGFGAPTLAALNTQAIDTTAGNYRAAAQAAGNANAGRGGDSGLQPGTVSQENATIASQAAGQLSQEQQNITLANQKQAQQNTATAIGGYNTLAGIQNPLGFGGLSNQVNTTAYGQQTQNAQEGAQEFADIAGGISGLVQTGAKLATGVPSFGGGGGTSLAQAGANNSVGEDWLYSGNSAA